MLPPAIITGPFLSDLIVSLSGILFLLLIILKKKFEYFKNIISFSFFLYCLYLIIISATSENNLLSFESSLFYFRFGILVLNIAYCINYYHKFLKLFGLSFLLVFLFVLIDSYFQLFFGNNLLGFTYAKHRLTGIFGEERVLGSYLSRCLPFLVALIIINVKNTIKVEFLIFILIFTSLPIIIFSGERTALFYFILFMILFFLLITNSSKLKLYIFFTSILSFFLVFLLSDSARDRMINFTTYQLNIKNELDSGGIRVFSVQHEVIYSTSLKIFRDNYVFGIGPKLFREVCKKDKYITLSKLDASINGCQTHPHNTYIQLLTETGVVGTIPLLFLLLNNLNTLIKQYFFRVDCSKIHLNNYRILLFISTLITLWPFVPNGNFFNNWLSIIYFLPIGFILSDYFKIKYD